MRASGEKSSACMAIPELGATVKLTLNQYSQSLYPGFLGDPKRPKHHTGDVGSGGERALWVIFTKLPDLRPGRLCVQKRLMESDSITLTLQGKQTKTK